ncbi:MAG TPA: c-type cytochrome [Candidatus Binatia bacterium]|nr:c-type cytochrome [Candidatus Binatia bacterium]
MKPSLLAAALLAVTLPAAHAAESPAVPAEAGTAPAGARTDVFTGGNAEAGGTRAAACAACHGPGGNSGNPEWPKLAGQHAPYVAAQLKLFKSGERKNPVMSPQAAQLTDDDIRNVAAFFATQKPTPGVASPDAVKIAGKIYRAGDPARGLPACAACHGPAGAGNAAAGYPRIGGQHAKYAAGSLRRLRDLHGEGTSPNAAAMSAIAAKLTDNEIEALASYVNGLH